MKKWQFKIFSALLCLSFDILMLAGQTTGKVAAARAIAFDPPPQATLAEAVSGKEGNDCKEKSDQLETSLSGSGLLQAAADTFMGPFSPELNGKTGTASAKQRAEGHPQQELLQPQARLELVSAYSLRIEEPRAIQKARKTTKGNLLKYTLLKGEA